MTKILLILLFTFPLVGSSQFFCCPVGPGGGGGGLLDFAYSPQTISFSAVDLTSMATTTVANVTEDGILTHIRGRMAVAVTGTPNIDLVITVDGTARTISFWDGTSSDPNQEWMAFSARDSSGGLIRSEFWIWTNTRYLTSLRVDLIVNTAATVGIIDVSVLRSLKIGTGLAQPTTGFVPQPLASSVGIELNSAGPTNTLVLDQAMESGILHGIGFRIECGGGVCNSGHGGAANANSFTVTVDGTATVFGFFTSGSGVWVPALVTLVHQGNSVFSGGSLGNGGLGGDEVYLPLQVRYHTSIRFETDFAIGILGTATFRAFAIRSVEL